MVPSFEERRLITILFADLSGFTTLSAKLDPEEVRDVANICLEYLNKAIINHGGTIHKYEGDSVIALFGFPLAHEDDPERAIKASLEMLRLLPEINKTLRSKLKKKTDLGLHIGINSGTVVVGEIGSDQKKEYTVMGDVVNFASRLKDMAKKGEILVSESVFRVSRYLFDYEVCLPISVKGIEELVEVFKPIRVKEKAEPKRGIKGLYSPLVGRDKEFEILKKAVENLTNKSGGAVFILGDAGLGKSRLYEELKKLITSYPFSISILEGRCLSYGEAVPYLPFLQILAHIFGITDQDIKEEIKKKLLERTKELFPDIWGEIVPYVGHLFSIRFSDQLDEKVKYLDAKSLRIQVFVNVKKLLTALSHIQPLLLTIEDYHWIDVESLELLKFIFDAPEPLPILFLGLSRIEKEKECFKTKDWLKKRLGQAFIEINLIPLDINVSMQLIYNLLKIPGVTKDFTDRVLAKAEGNPFFLEEIIRSLIDSKVLFFSSGIWHLTSSISSLQIPDTIQAVIASRLDRLEPEARNILQMASVIGRSFYVKILEHLCGLDNLMLALYLSTLEEFEYISKLKSHPELEYQFRHPLLMEIAYNSILKKRRRELHYKTGEAIKEIYKDRLDDFTELLAFQYSNSDNYRTAIEWLKKAGFRAKSRYANEEAIKYFQMMVSIVKEDFAGAVHELSLQEIYEALGDIYILRGEYDSALKYYEEMHQTAGDNKIGKARAMRKITDVYRNQGKLDDTLKILSEIETMLIENSAEERLEKSEICMIRSWVYWMKGELDKAVKENEMGLKIVDDAFLLGTIDEAQLKRRKSVGYNNLASVLWVRGEYDKMIELYIKCLKISEEIGDKQTIAKTSGNLAIAYYQKGEHDKAIELCQRSLRTFEEIGDKQSIGKASLNLGSMFDKNGEYDKAFEYFQRDLKISEEIGYKRGMGIANGNLGSIYQNKGEYDKAIDLYQKYLRVSEEIGEKQGIGRANGFLGQIFLELDELAKAEKFLFEAEKVLNEIGDRDTLSGVYIGLAATKSKKVLVSSQELQTKELVKEPLWYADKALKIAFEMNSISKKGECYFVYGKIYTSVNDFKMAEENFQKAIEIFEKEKNKKSLADVCLEYGRMLKKAVMTGIYSSDLANEYLNKARGIYKELKLDHKIKEGNV